MRATISRTLLVAGALSVVLAACGHSRVVRRDYPSQAPGSRQPPASSPSTRASSLPRDGVHIVRRGETLYGISFRFGLRFQDVAAWNGIYDPYVIEIGQRIRLRPAAYSRSSAVTANPQGVRPGRSQTPRNYPLSPSPAAAIAPPLRPSAPVAGVPQSAVAQPAPQGESTGAPAWRWPARGQIIGRYVIGDQTQQGINIAGEAGQQVSAAADGIVVYSGAGLVGYGELIIIKHSEEWLSAYAHNRRRLVTEGTRVKSGEAIAELGRTGAIRNMLHFEIRRNGKPVDPLGYLPKP